MKDFRDKIKNYKVEPSESAFEKMLIKQQKDRLSKWKYGLYAMIGLNVLGFVWLMFSMSNHDDTTVINQVSASDQVIEASGAHDPSDLYLSEELADLNTANDSLGLTIATLRKRISQLTSTISTQSGLLSSYQSPDQVSLVGDRARLESTDSEPRNYYSNAIHDFSTPHKQSIDQSDLIEKPSMSLPLMGLVPKISNRGVSIEQYLLNLAANSSKPIIKNYTPSSTPNKTLLTNWYVTIGVRGQNLVTDRQRNIHIGLNRELTKRFDAGVLFDIGQIRERNDFLINNEVKDFRVNAFGMALLRYKFISRPRLNVYVDGGIGYRYGIISFRQSQVIDNELVYFNDSQEFTDLLTQIALGAMYDVTPRLRLGTRFYLDGNLHSSLDVSYRF